MGKESVMELGDKVEVLLNGQWHDAVIVSGSGKMFGVRVEGRGEVLAYGDPEQIPGAGEYLRAVGAGLSSATQLEEDELARCRAARCQVPAVGAEGERWWCPTCRKKWVHTARGSWALADSFQLTAEQEADVEELRVTSRTGGQKGKKLARYDLLPGDALWKIAELYGRGSEKYADRNWERGYDWSLSFAALQRHIWKFWNGEDFDEEMGMEHVACAIFHALTLLTFMQEHPEFDDRPSTLKRTQE